VPCQRIPVPSLPLADRIGRRLFGVHYSDGIAICVLKDDADVVRQRIVDALGLLKRIDTETFSRVRRDLAGGIKVESHLQNRAQFNPRSFACEFEWAMLTGEIETEEIALTIVHEAAHARLWRLGVPYTEDLRPRVEAICIRREVAFARKLPDGKDWADWVERGIKSFDGQFLTDQAFSEREKKYRWRSLRHIRKLGMPKWFVRGLVITGLTIRKVFSFLRRERSSDP
jgi:hypothetical protein